LPIQHFFAEIYLLIKFGRKILFCFPPTLMYPASKNMHLAHENLIYEANA